MHSHNDAFPSMVSTSENKVEMEPQRIRLTARLSIPAYEVLTEMQRRHRRQTGRALPLWRIIDAAVMNYAQREGIQPNEQ